MTASADLRSCKCKVTCNVFHTSRNVQSTLKHIQVTGEDNLLCNVTPNTLSHIQKTTQECDLSEDGAQK